MSSISFDINSVLDEARSKAGLDNFGSDDFMPGLAVLLQTYDQCGYNEKGRKRARRRVVDLLAARLRIEQAFIQHPEIDQVEIKQPMYLTGLPRTGTSALLNLLANDDAARPLKLWEGMMPDPFEPFQHGVEDPRYRAMKDWQDEQASKNPDFSKIHHTSADTPEECIHLLNHTFCDVQFGIETMMEPYGSWFREQDLSKSYHYYARLLRMLQWQRPGERWLLKSPAHLWALDCIDKEFPDACIIITHRNPLEAVTSYASMMAAMMIEREYDKKTLGPVVMEYLAQKVERSLRLRENIAKERILDLQFNDFVADSVSFVHGIYDYFRLPMTNSASQRIEEYAKQHPMNKHGKHQYDLEQFGLSEAQVLKRFAFYIDRFNVPMA